MDGAGDPLDYDPPPMPTEAELREMMERSEADILAGRTVPWKDVLSMMETRIQEMEKRLHTRQV